MQCVIFGVCMCVCVCVCTGGKHCVTYKVTRLFNNNICTFFYCVYFNNICTFFSVHFNNMCTLLLCMFTTGVL